MENHMKALKKKNKKIELPFDTVIPLLGTYSKEINSLSLRATHVFTAVLFTIAMTWKQPSVHQQMNGKEYIYNTLEKGRKHCLS